MATKSYKPRFDFQLLKELHANNLPEFYPAEKVHQWLWDTHLAFNEGVDHFTTWLLRMYRGAGVCRECSEGIWGEWQEITTHAALIKARTQAKSDPTKFATIENHELLKVFTDRGKSEPEAVDLAECCRRIAKRLCPPSEERDNRPMPRSSLDKLINPFSEAEGVRPGPTTFRWQLVRVLQSSESFGKFTAAAEQTVRDSAGNSEKELKRLRDAAIKSFTDAGLAKTLFADWCLPSQQPKRRPKKNVPQTELTPPSGEGWSKACSDFVKTAPRPDWLEDRVIARAAKNAASWEELLEAIESCDELQSDDGQQRIERLRERASKSKKPWSELKEPFIADLVGDTDDFGKLLHAGVLPLPGFACYHDESSVTLGPVVLRDAGSEWKRGMWDMAGQRVRSHLGWVRRRAGERLLWEKRKQLFEQGGWIRTTRDGKKIRDADLTATDIVFQRPLESSGEFEEKPAYGDREWFKALRAYETKDMLKHLERVSFSASTAPKLTKRTIKGWFKIRDKWIDCLKEDRETSQDDLVEEANKLRKRKPRDFGDQRIFEWLAHPDRRWLWNENLSAAANDCGRDDRDCVSAFTAYNEQIADKPESVTFTRSHPTKHPVWAFFGENSAVKYWLRQQPVHRQSKSDGKVETDDQRLILILAELLERQDDGSFTAKKQVAIPLKGYADFEASFDLANVPEPKVDEPVDATESAKQKTKKPKQPPPGITAKQKLRFKDDLLAGQTREGTLSGIKLSWNRAAMEQAQNQHDKRRTTNRRGERREPPLTPPTERVYAAFSCDAGTTELPQWLMKHVGYLDRKNKHDGLTNLFKLNAEVRYATKKPVKGSDQAAEGTDDLARKSKTLSSDLLAPEARKWPIAAIENSLRVRGTDLGFRVSSAGSFWRLSLDRPAVDYPWIVGECIEDRRTVYAVLEEDYPKGASLPGDDDVIPEEARLLRETLKKLRTRLNLNNALLRIVRLLLLTTIERRVPKHDESTKLALHKKRRRSDGVSRSVGLDWTDAEPIKLTNDDIEDNCRKAATQLLTWSAKDAILDSLSAIGWQGSLWERLADPKYGGVDLQNVLPKTEVPTEKEAKEKRIDRDALKSKRDAEEEAFADAVHVNRVALARALCDGFDVCNKRRATSGLWFEFDHALLREVSYGDKQHRHGTNEILDDGLFRLLRKPPVTKHADRKDEDNNLPHGKTHRGGLSMARLNFLDDVKSFVRKWSYRSRWPGDMRRPPEDQKLNRQDTEHLDHLREHRAKLIAHADVAQALGFDQDLRRGVWKFRDPQGCELWHRPERKHFYRKEEKRLIQVATPEGVSDETASHPNPAHKPAHILIYEDLSRYKFSSDRPKNENAGLARWSHRQILKFAQHIGGLFGMPIATVPAAYSSRFCSRCGAPGCRAVRFDPTWLKQDWMKRIRASNQPGDKFMKAVANKVQAQLDKNANAFCHEENWLWVLRDGGTHFVCSNRKCKVHNLPINADENAAANIGLWFLRGIEDFKTKIDSKGKVLNPLRHLVIGQFQQSQDEFNRSCWCLATEAAQSTEKPIRRINTVRTNEEDIDTTDDTDEQESSGVRWVFRDPSGNSFASDCWYEAKDFWNRLKQFSAQGIKADFDSSRDDDDD